MVRFGGAVRVKSFLVGLVGLLPRSQRQNPSSPNCKGGGVKTEKKPGFFIDESVDPVSQCHKEGKQVGHFFKRRENKVGINKRCHFQDLTYLGSLHITVVDHICTGDKILPLVTKCAIR